MAITFFTKPEYLPRLVDVIYGKMAFLLELKPSSSGVAAAERGGRRGVSAQYHSWACFIFNYGPLGTPDAIMKDIRIFENK